MSWFGNKDLGYEVYKPDGDVKYKIDTKGSKDAHDKLDTQKTLDNIEQKLRNKIHSSGGF